MARRRVHPAHRPSEPTCAARSGCAGDSRGAHKSQVNFSFEVDPCMRVDALNRRLCFRSCGLSRVRFH